VSAATLTRHSFRLTIPADAKPSRPYFLGAPRAASQERGTPLGEPAASVQIEIDIAGQTIIREVEAVYRFADQARGEVRRPLFVVPAVAVRLEPGATVWSLDRDGVTSFSVSLRGEEPDGVNGRVRLEAPEGWSVSPAEAGFTLDAPVT
jgi:hypothetical protein